MADKQFKTYCRIMDYIEMSDPDLAQLIRGLCVDMTLGSLKGKSGITFLMPQDKAFRAKLEKLAYSDKIEDANMASNMLNALIIRDVFKTPSEWMAKKDDIPNSLFPSQHVDIDSATPKEIVFKSGARAVLDTEFKDASRKQNLAVWKLTGEIPVTVDKPAKNKYAKVKGRGKVGGYVPDANQTQSLRFQIAIAVENSYALCRLQHHSGLDQSGKDVYLEIILSLINFIIHIRKDVSIMYDKILPLISFDKLDFYLLVEPHRISGDYLLDNSLISDWWAQRQSLKFSICDVMKTVEDLLNTSQNSALIYTNRPQLLDEIAKVRQRVTPVVESQPRASVVEIEKYYVELESKNTINGVGPVYPPNLANFYNVNQGLKMLHDELRYVTWGAFKNLESGAFDIGSFHELANMIGECLYTVNAEERARAQKLLNKTALKFMIAPTDKVQEIKTFLYSTMFLYIPLTQSECKNLKVKYSVSRPNPNNIMMWNLQENIYVRHRRLLTHTNNSSNGDIINLLRALNVNTLDPELRDELKKKFNI